jgi:lipopolysaccharide export system permease protein
MKRIHTYVLGELVLPFFMSLGLVSFLLLMEKVLSLVDLVLKNGVPVSTVLELIVDIMPATFAITVPMSLLVAVLLALGRLASDLELVALRAGGISLARLYPPLLALGLVFSLGMVAFNETLLPNANESYKVLLYEVLRQRSDVALQEKAWVKDFEGLVVYVESRDPQTHELSGLTILRPAQAGQPLQWIRAKHGRLVSDPGGYHLYLDLFNGNMQSLGGKRGEDFTSVDFQSSRMDLDIEGVLSQIQDKDRQPQEMGMADIWSAVQAMPPGDPRRPHYLTEMHKKAAIPFACLFFLLCGLPLGTLTRKGGRMLGFILAIGLIFLYYLLLSLGQTYGDDGRLWPWLAMWLPNLAMGGIALAAGRAAFRGSGVFAFSRG